MKLLLVVATKAEVAPLFDYYDLPDKKFIQTPKFDVLITGVGMTATAFALGQYLNPHYYLVLNVGIAGSFDQKIELGSLVHITSDTFAELGVEDDDQFISIDELGFGQSTYALATPFIPDILQVKGITVNKVHGNTTSIALIQKRFAVQTESMEGAAVCYACSQLNIPLLQVRSISNYIEQRNTANWKIELAIKNLHLWLINYLDLLATK